MTFRRRIVATDIAGVPAGRPKTETGLTGI